MNEPFDAKLLWPYGSQYPNRRYLPITIVAIPNRKTLTTLRLGTLDPWGGCGIQQPCELGLSICFRLDKCSVAGVGVLLKLLVRTRNPRLALKIPQILSNRDHKALNEEQWGVLA